MQVIKDLLYDGKNALDLYLPNRKDFSTIVYFHGGGLVEGKKEDAKEIAEEFVENGYAFVSVDYTLYTQGAKFPKYVEDCAKATKFTLDNIENYGGDKKKVYVSGSSAGAWISLMLCLDEEFFKEVSVDKNEIAGYIIESAQTTSHFNVMEKESGGDCRLQRIDKFAPLYYLNEKSAFSKMLLIFYDDDMPCRYEQNMLFYKAVLNFNKDADIEYKVLSGTHCSGINKRDESGSFPVVKTAIAWLKK